MQSWHSSVWYYAQSRHPLSEASTYFECRPEPPRAPLTGRRRWHLECSEDAVPPRLSGELNQDQKVSKNRDELTTSSSRFGPSARAGSLVCTSPELSYEIITREMYQTSQGSTTSRSAVLVDHNTTSALIMNPITAGLAGLGMILACIAALVRGRVMHGVG